MPLEPLCFRYLGDVTKLYYQQYHVPFSLVIGVNKTKLAFNICYIELIDYVRAMEELIFFEIRRFGGLLMGKLKSPYR